MKLVKWKIKQEYETKIAKITGRNVKGLQKNDAESFLSFYLSIYLSVYLSIYLSIFMSVCLYNI